MEQTATAIELFLAELAYFFYDCISWLNSLVATIMSKPAFVILIFGMPIVGFAVGLFKRLKNA